MSGHRFNLVIISPPFGKKSAIAIINGEGNGEVNKESLIYEPQGFCDPTKKQLRFLTTCKDTLNGHWSGDNVVPDMSCLKQGRLKPRKRLLSDVDVHYTSETSTWNFLCSI
jgi:type I restriction enzyme M protein